MKATERLKNRIFICTLAAIAVAVNASQEFKYAREHPVFAPQVARQSQPPIPSEPAVQSPPASSPAPSFAPSQPPTSYYQPAVRVESEAFAQPVPIVAAKEKPAPMPEQTRESAVELSQADKAIEKTNQIFVKNGISPMMNSAETPQKESVSDVTEQQQKDLTETDNRSHQTDMRSQTAPTSVTKSQSVHYETAKSPQKGASLLMQKNAPLPKSAPMPVQDSTPTISHHSVARFFNTVLSPVKTLLPHTSFSQPKTVNHSYKPAPVKSANTTQPAHNH